MLDNELPEAPLKREEKRAANWQALMGVEQTEIDYLVQLRPALLRQLAVKAIEPFYDRTLDRRVEKAAEEWRSEAQPTPRPIRRAGPGWRSASASSTSPAAARPSMTPTGASSMRELCLGERRASREIPPSQPAQVKAGLKPILIACSAINGWHQRPSYPADAVWDSARAAHTGKSRSAAVMRLVISVHRTAREPGAYMTRRSRPSFRLKQLNQSKGRQT